MMALFFCMAIGMVLAATLTMIRGRYQMTMRSSCWNEAIPVLEAGIEEAMTHMRDDTSPGVNGWTASTINGQTVYRKQRSFDDGSYFYATIYNPASSAPYIISQGYVRAPLKTSQYIARTVLVTTRNPPNVFTKAIATTGLINFNGSNPMVDSYDDSVGAYDAVTNHGTVGNIATDSTNVPAITLGGGTVYGSVTTGPGGTITGGTISGTTNNNMNVAFPSNYPPVNASTYGSMPGATTVGGTNAYYLTSDSYQTSAFSSSGTPIIVSGNVILYDTGSFNISGQGYVLILPNSSLTLYVGGSASIGGQGIQNTTGMAENLSMLGLAGCTSFSYTGQGTLFGTIDAPGADVTIKGNGGIYGAVIGKTATLSGNGIFHYPTGLAKAGDFVATSWTELANSP